MYQAQKREGNVIKERSTAKRITFGNLMMLT